MSYFFDRIHAKIIAPENIPPWRESLVHDQLSIVSTNGVFDILHRGHLNYLMQAREFASKLIVVVNDDESVKRLKGDSRPVNTLNDRMFFLASLEFVDAVTFFSEDTPVGILRTIRPNIHVKGGDYLKEDLPETEIVEKYGGEIKILPFVDGYSTTNIIDKIKSK